MNNIISVIEFTTNKIKIVLGYKFHKKNYILKAMESTNIQLSLNGLLDKNSCYEYISSAMTFAKREFISNENLFANLIVLYPPYGFKINTASAEVVTCDPSGIIVQSDYQNCINSINIANRVLSKSIIYDEPIAYKDSFDRVYEEFPLGQKSEKIQIKCDIQMIDENCFNYYNNIVKDLQLTPKLSLISSVSGKHFITSFAAISDFIQLEVDDEITIFTIVMHKRVTNSIIFKYGNNIAIKGVAESLQVDYKKIKKFLFENGLNSSENFDIRDEHGKTRKEYVSALKNEYEKLILAIVNEVKKYNVPTSIPIVLYGQSSKIKNFDLMLQEKINSQVFVFESKVIGARGTDYINTMGAINISAYNYVSFVEKNSEYNSLNLNSLRG